MNEKIYPEFYYSNEIENILCSVPKFPEEIKKPVLPVEPRKPDEEPPIPVFLILIAIGFIIFLSSVAKEGSGFFIVLLSLIPVGMIVLNVKHNNNLPNERNEYNRRMSEYRTDLFLFDSKMEQYNKDVRAREMKIAELTSAKNLQLYRRNKIKQLSKKKLSFESCEAGTVKQGPSEDFFYDYLRIYSEFSSYKVNVYRNVRIPIVSSFYYPDFVFTYDNLVIDIEIDEPYEIDEGSPIHYKNDSHSGVDDDRNRFFTKNGWCVIRFAEEQIYNQPSECIMFIEDFINSIKKGERVDLSSVCLKPIDKWTKEESNKMAYKKYRDNYLPGKNAMRISVRDIVKNEKASFHVFPFQDGRCHEGTDIPKWLFTCGTIKGLVDKNAHTAVLDSDWNNLSLIEFVNQEGNSLKVLVYRKNRA